MNHRTGAQHHSDHPVDHADPPTSATEGPHRTSWRMAAQATLHCLTGCAIGEVLGMVIGTALGWSPVAIRQGHRKRGADVDTGAQYPAR